MIGRSRPLDALKDLFKTHPDQPAMLRVPAAQVADLIAYVERLEAEVHRLRAAENFGSDAA